MPATIRTDLSATILLFSALLLLAAPAFAPADDCGVQLTDTNINERWGTRQNATSGGHVIWANEVGDVYHYDGALTSLVQLHDPNVLELADVETSVFTLGSGEADGQVIGLWRRFTDFAWVWSSDGGAPKLVAYESPYNAGDAMNPEGVAIADGCVFLLFQAFDPNTNVLIKHVFQVDPAGGGATLLTGDYLGDTATGGAGAFVTSLMTDGCHAAWIWCSAADNGACLDYGTSLHYFDGIGVQEIDKAGAIFSFKLGRILYPKTVNGIRQLFLYDTSLATPEPVQLTDFQAGDRQLLFAQSDGRHVAMLLADENGKNREIQWLGGFAMTNNDTQPADDPISFNFPIQMDRGQLLWDSADGAVHIFDGMEKSEVCSQGWLADGHLAMLRKSAESDTEVDVFSQSLAAPHDEKSIARPYAITADATDNGKIALTWEPILGATLYNLYYALETGIRADNYDSLDSGGKMVGLTANNAVVSHLIGDKPWYFVVTAVEGSDESAASPEATAVACVDPSADRDRDGRPDCVDDDPTRPPADDNLNSNNLNDDGGPSGNSNNNISSEDDSSNDNTHGDTTTPPLGDLAAGCGDGVCGPGAPLALSFSFAFIAAFGGSFRPRRRYFPLGILLAAAMIALAFVQVACDTMPSSDNTNSNDQPSDPTTGTWNDVDGLTLTGGEVTLVVPAHVTPSNTTLTLTPIAAGELLPDGLDEKAGFDVGMQFEPDGTTFSAPVKVTAKLSAPTTLQALPVLLLDESTGIWGWAGVDATVEDDGVTAYFEIEHFSRYRFWNPPPPAGDVEISNEEIISGTGFFEGQPFNTLPSPDAAEASLVYSPFGNAFGLSIVQTDVTNPATGDFVVVLAGLHASMVGDLEKAKVGIVTPAGGLSGQSAFVDGISPAKGVSGIMYLRKSATNWMVDVFCAYEGGIIFGQASGEL